MFTITISCKLFTKRVHGYGLNSWLLSHGESETGRLIPETLQRLTEQLVVLSFLFKDNQRLKRGNTCDISSQAQISIIASSIGSVQEVFSECRII